MGELTRKRREQGLTRKELARRLSPFKGRTVTARTVQLIELGLVTRILEELRVLPKRKK